MSGSTEAQAAADDEQDTTGEYRTLIAGSGDVNTVAGIDGIYRYVSPACRDLFGWDPAELEGRQRDDFVHPDDVSLSSLQRHGSRAPKKNSTYRFLCRDGAYRWVEATSRTVETRTETLVVSALRDITERQRSDATLQRQAFSDPLTGVANRTVLMDRLNQALRRQSRGDGVLAVLYVDLDRFKVINDSLGHRTGDAVLLQMAERLTHHLRPADTLARLGGDEFVIVAEALANEETAIELAKRITEAGHAPFQVGDEEFTCTLSVGVACTADSERSAQELLQEADLALYRAKDLGRDRVEMFDEDLRTKAVGRLVTERMLRRALQDQRIVVEYQPIIDLTTRQRVGAEALIRIDDRGRGLLQPESFLEVAEETGLLIAMDQLVLVDAVHQASAWRSRLPADDLVEVSINVTARHLADEGFAASVIEQLDAAGVGGHDFQVEVTERVLMEASNSAMTGLRALRDVGVQVGLDDFGTGYSSLAYLQQFPLDFVKIDRSFISELDHVANQQAIVAAIITLSHALGLTVVAEGVETRGQLSVLESLGCDRGQGFLLGRPGRPNSVDRPIAVGGPD